MSSRPALLLFDLGGVLLESTGHERLCQLAGVNMPVDEYRERWLRSPAVCRFESGGSTPDEFAAQFIDEWQLSLTRSAFLHEFTHWPRDIHAGVRKRVLGLRAHCRTACLSNSNELHWQRFGRFEGLFDVALSSHELGVLKPQPAAFTRALEILDVSPGDVMFFDDSRSNVDSAARVGLRAFQVEGFNALDRLLAAHGL